MPTIEVRAFPATLYMVTHEGQYRGSFDIEDGETVTLYDFTVLSPTQALVNVTITREVPDA